MKPSRTPRMIDLTGHLQDLRSSLSPNCRHFSGTHSTLGETYRDAPAPDPTLPMRRLFIAFLLITASILAAYLSTRQ